MIITMALESVSQRFQCPPKLGTKLPSHFFLVRYDESIC